METKFWESDIRSFLLRADIMRRENKKEMSRGCVARGDSFSFLQAVFELIEIQSQNKPWGVCDNMSHLTARVMHTFCECVWRSESTGESKTRRIDTPRSEGLIPLPFCSHRPVVELVLQTRYV
jgi:hypothetical protein